MPMTIQIANVKFKNCTSLGDGGSLYIENVKNC